MRFALFLLCVLAAPGCAASTPAPTVGGNLNELQARAAFDLGCPPQQLRLYNFDERSKGVVGCGRRLTYVHWCQLTDGVNRCTWVLDTPTPSQHSWPAQVAAQPAGAVPVVAGDDALFSGRGAIQVRPPRPTSKAVNEASPDPRELPCRDRSCARFRDPKQPDPEAAPSPNHPGGQAVDRGF